jgi:hypothetical protein
VGSAATPVQIVSCNVGEDGSGSTTAQLGFDNQVTHNTGPMSLVGCGQSLQMSPATSTINGACETAQGSCSATASASATGGTTTVVPTSGPATITASASGNAAAATGGQDSGVNATAEQSADGAVTFTVTAPVSFTVSGSTSRSGQNLSSSTTVGVRLAPGTGSGDIFALTTPGANSASGTLQPGKYFLIGFVDARAGAHFNSSDPTTSSSSSQVSANVTLTLTPGGGCPADAIPSVQVGIALAEGCFSERKDAQGHGTGVFETDQEAWVGGFDLRPQAGGKLVLEPANQTAPIRAEGNGVDLVLSPSFSIPAPLGELKPFTPSYTLGVNTAGSLSRLLALPLIRDSTGQVTVTWGPGGASSTVEAKISIEDLSKNLGTAFSEAAGHSVGTLAGTLKLVLSNNAPIDLSGASLDVPEFAVELKDTDPPLKLGFGGAKFTEETGTDGTPQWSAKVTTLFPWEDRQGSLTGGLSFSGSALSSLTLGLSGFQVALGKTGWNWTGANGTLGFSPSLAFDVGVDAEEAQKVAGEPLFKLSGSVKGLQLATDCTNGQNPFEFLLSGNSPPLEKENIGTLTTQVHFCAYVPSAANFAFEAGVSSQLDVDVETPVIGVTAKKVVTATGSATGWFSGTDFNLDGQYQLTLPVIGTIGAHGVLSSAGYALCGTYGFITEGIGTQNWLTPPEDLASCDMTPFTALPHAAADIAAVGAARVIHVPAGQRVFGLAVRGRAAAPRVRVIGPGGISFLSPAGAHPLRTSRAIIVPVDQLRTTYVYLHNPARGRWRIVPVAGSIIRIDSAHLLPRPHVAVKLTRLRNGKIRVRWAARRIAGQQLRLLDRAAGSATTIQRLTSAGRGTITFTPVNPLASRRTIEADVFQRGKPRAQLIAARYRLTLGGPPGKVGAATVKRTAGGLSVGWGRASRAHSYLVTLSAGASTITATETTATSVVLQGAPVGPLTVTITPRDALGRAGPSATVHVA